MKSPVRRIHKVKTGTNIKETYSDEALELMRDNCTELRDLHNSCMASTRASLNESNLAILNIPIPDEKLILGYEKILCKMRLSILKNNDETQKLIDLRDWLLPMLMNGQATIND